MLESKIILFILITSLASCFRCLSTVTRKEHDDNLLVEISNGLLQGKHIVSECNNVSYYGFLGIPYAKPPVGDLRFSAPEPAFNWTGILNATTDGSECPQSSEGSENCLFLNVYTPHTSRPQDKSLLPVMVHIHGGGFMIGSNNFNINGPDYLMEQGVIVVTLNYRLGIFGFLCTGDLAIPGNYGLKDQIEALKWVQRNILQFGGDPLQVTIYGSSAGAASVHYLLQTPLANGLFHRAITESGSTLCNWSLYSEPKKIAFRIGNLAGIETNNTYELVTRLRSTAFEELADIEQEVFLGELQNIYDDGIPFSPCMEPEHESAVITKGSYGLLSSNQFNKVPLLTGFNSQESLLILGEVVLTAMNMMKPYLALKDSSPNTIVHKNLNISSNIQKTEVGLAIKSYYFGQGLAAKAPIDKILDYMALINILTQSQLISFYKVPTGMTVFNYFSLKDFISVGGAVISTRLVKFLSDDQLLRSIYKTVKLLSKSVPVYFYRFSYETPTRSSTEKTTKGVGHGKQVGYIFCSRNKMTSLKPVNSVSSKMVKLWTNFAKTGNPTPIAEELLDYVIWPVAIKQEKYTFLGLINADPKRNDVTFLDINEHLTVNVNPRKAAMAFWENLYQNYSSLDGTF